MTLDEQVEWFEETLDENNTINEVLLDLGRVGIPTSIKFASSLFVREQEDVLCINSYQNGLLWREKQEDLVPLKYLLHETERNMVYTFTVQADTLDALYEDS